MVMAVQVLVPLQVAIPYEAFEDTDEDPCKYQTHNMKDMARSFGLEKMCLNVFFIFSD